VIELPVVWGEMDSYGHVNNVVYFRYMESGRVEYMRRLDWMRLQQQTGIGPILGAISCRFRKALVYPDTIAVGVRTSSVSDDRVTMEHQIVSRTMGVLVAEGQGTVVSYDYNRQSKVPLPDEIRRRIAELEASIPRAGEPGA
jgi:acyl-CoA thioester hydrolase